MSKISDDQKHRNEVRRKVSSKVSENTASHFCATAVFSKMEQALRNSKVCGKTLSKKKAGEIVFHMHDWLFELMALVSYYKTPDKFSEDEISVILMNFLIHAPAHIAAAKKLYTGEPVQDIFNIGAVEDKQR